MEVAGSVCLACTKHRSSDDVAKLFAFICFTPYIVLIYIASVAHATRDVTAAFIGLGALVNTGLSLAVKHFLRHPRPPETCAFIGKCHKYGMPSSHAQVMAYAFTTGVLMHVHRRKNRKNFNSSATEMFELFELVFLAGLSVLVGIARVYLGYHSVDQVLAGVALGSGFSAFWFCLIAMVHSTGLAEGNSKFNFSFATFEK
ncbi:hypothetical protein Ndes2437B_g05328 [Nannochloris sp. 'desiccata']